LEEIINFIAAKDGYIALQGPRQTGKTTLLYQVQTKLHKKSYGVVYIDLQGMKSLGKEMFYQRLCDLIWTGLDGLVDMSNVPWQLQKIGDEWKFSSYLTWLSAHTPLARKLIVILDEIGSVPDNVYLTFFQSLLNFYNTGAQGPNRDLNRKFTIIFAGALDLGRLLEGENSPVRNISEPFFLQDFSKEQVRNLTKNLEDYPRKHLDDIAAAVFSWTDGHPYLTMRLYELVESNSTFKDASAAQIPELIHQLILSKVLYGGDNNLAHIIKHLLDEKKYKSSVYKIFNKERRKSIAHFEDLLAIGIFKRSNDFFLIIRNRIYEERLRAFFDQKEDGQE